MHMYYSINYSIHAIYPQYCIKNWYLVRKGSRKYNNHIYHCNTHTTICALLTLWIIRVLELCVHPFPNVVHRWVVPPTIQLQAQDTIISVHLHMFKKLSTCEWLGHYTQLQWLCILIILLLDTVYRSIYIYIYILCVCVGCHLVGNCL